MGNFAIKSFKVKGFKKFENEFSINFETKENKYNYKHSVKTINLNNGGKRCLNSAIGIIGANTSGKSSILEALAKYLDFNKNGIEYFNFANGFFVPRHFPKKIFEEYNFNGDLIEIEMKFICDEGEFSHNLTFFKNNSFSEDIYFGKKNIWSIERGNKETLNFLRFYQVLSTQNSTKMSQQAEKLKDDQNIFGAYIFNFIDSVIMNIPIVEKNRLIDQSWMGIINQSILLKNDLDLLKKRVSKIIAAVDSNIYEVNIESREVDNILVPSRKELQLLIKYITLKNGKKIPLENLSHGTLQFLSKVLTAFSLSEMNKKNFTYFFIDELDNSWHPNLTKFFIRLFKFGYFKKVILVFTAHNPYIFEELRKDAIFLIQEDSTINSLNNMRWNDKPLRNDFQFAKNYFDEIIGSHPSQGEFLKFIEGLENDQ